MLNSTFNKPYLTPPPEHPRLMFRASDMARIEKNLILPENSRARELWEYLCSLSVCGEGATPEYGTYHLREYLAVEAKAFLAAIEKEAGRAADAIDSLFVLLDSFSVTGGNMAARWCGHLIFISAEVYDWCYDFLSREQKIKIIERCEELGAASLEMGYPPTRQAALSGHGSEAQLLRDLLAFSIAVYDERPDIYDFCAGRIFDEFVPAYNYLFSSHGHPQGPSYGAYRYTSALWAAMIFRAMSGADIFSRDLAAAADYYLYMRRPGGEAFRLGDDFYETKDDYTRKHPFAVPMFFAAAYTGDPIYQELFFSGMSDNYLLPEKCGMDYYEGGSFGEGFFSPVVQLIWYGYTAPSERPDLPKYKYFGSPIGMTVWNDPETETAVIMKIGELWGANHDHLDTGCFQIYRRGILASDSGVYDSYGSPHRKNYLIHTIAHNCLTVTDPDPDASTRATPDAPIAGGVRRPRAGAEPKSLDQWQSEYRMARVVYHTESERCCEIQGDLSEAYRHTCDSVTRTMRFEPSAGVFTVIDEVWAKDANYIKEFHLHCQSEPYVKGNRIVIDNGTASLICEVILPENPVITITGGAGKEFFVGERNYGSERAGKAEAGWGRISISPSARSISDRFFIRMRIVDN